MRPHRRHRCGACDCQFTGSTPAVSNPIAVVRELLEGAGMRAAAPVRATRTLDIKQADFPGGIQVWASNPAIIWTAERPEQEGIHVHLYAAPDGRRPVEDETFDTARVDGVLLDEAMVRHFMAQQALAYIAGRVESLSCPHCGGAHFGRGEWGFTPHAIHVCEHCGKEFRPRAAVAGSSAIRYYSPSGSCGDSPRLRAPTPPPRSFDEEEGLHLHHRDRRRPGAPRQSERPRPLRQDADTWCVHALGACMPNIRRAVERGDWIFIISGKVPGVQQYVTGGMEVDEKIGVLAAYERFSENRLSLDDNGRVVGNIIVQPDGSQHPLDTHPAESFSARIENYIVGCDPLALTTPREFETGRRQTLDRLAEILDRPKANRVIDIVSRWRRLNADQVDAMVRWLSDIKAAP